MVPCLARSHPVVVSNARVRGRQGRDVQCGSSGSNKKTPPFHEEGGCSSRIFLVVLRVVSARLRNIDLELVVSHGIVVEHTDRLIGLFLRGHGHKGEAP